LAAVKVLFKNDMKEIIRKSSTKSVYGLNTEREKGKENAAYRAYKKGRAVIRQETSSLQLT